MRNEPISVFGNTLKDIGSFDYFKTIGVVCYAYATKLEAHLYGRTEGVNQEYGKRFRELNTGLKHEQNSELRSGLLKGDKSPE